MDTINSLSNFIQQFGGTGLVIALSAWLGKLWADRSLIETKAQLEEKLQKSKHQHETAIKSLEKDFQIEMIKKDQFHQISKSTFQDIFDNKIKIYTNLLKLKVEFDKLRYEDGTTEIFNPSYNFASHFNLFRENIENNRIYISNELSDKYDAWYHDATPYFRKMNEIEFEIEAQSGDSQIDSVMNEIFFQQSPIVNELVNNTIEKMTDIIDQIEKDVQLIRRNLSSIESS